MDKKLFLAIDKAENEFKEAEELQQAIVALSTNKTATTIILYAMRDAIMNYETFWNVAEDMPEFKALYQDRDQAREDYLKAQVI